MVDPAIQLEFEVMNHSRVMQPKILLFANGRLIRIPQQQAIDMEANILGNQLP